MVRASTLPALAGVLLVLAVPASPARAQVTRVLVRTVHTGPKEALDPLLNQVAFQGGRRAAFLITRALGDPDPDVRDRAAYALGILAVHGTERALEKVVDDPDWSVRQDAIFALGKLRDRRATRNIARRLADPKRSVRLEAAQALAKLGDPHGGRALVEALKKVGDDRELEMALLKALGRCRWRGATRALKAKTRDGSEAVRLAALRALASMGDKRARLSLLARLDGPSAYARVDAARLLGQVPGHWSDGALRTALTDSAPKVRIAAAEALGAHGEVEGLEFLVNAVDHAGPQVSLAAADALQRLKIPEARLTRLRAKMRRARDTQGDAGTGDGGSAGGSAPHGERTPRPSPLKVAESVAGEPFPARLDAISRAFLGTPYLESPLGEGAGFDPDPLIRYDRVDCLTYVDTVLALASSPDPDHVLHALLQIRYRDGVPAFGHRNHLMMDEWIPDNEQKGFVRSIAREIAGAEVKVAEKDLTASLWNHRRGVPLPLSAHDLPLRRARLAYVPIDRFPAVMSRIPDGTILLVVRRDRPLEPIRVTHVGFVFRVHGHLVLRHAAKALWHQVVDERLADFVRRNSLYRKWPVAGFALLQPTEHTGRMAKAEATPAAR